MHWFLNLMEELGIECRVGHPAMIRCGARLLMTNPGVGPVTALAT
jgi:hypothetical protein